MTSDLAQFVTGLGWDQLPADVRNAMLRHTFDTFGVLIAGASSELTNLAASELMAGKSDDDLPLPGRRDRAAPLNFAYICGLAIHGLEMDDGYRMGSIHPASTVIPAALAAAHMTNADGAHFLQACVAGYETVTAIAEACHPDLRLRGFHPTGAIGVFGAAVAASLLLGLNERQVSNALGLAASSGAGLYAFINGGADVKRLHAGHAAQQGLLAALLARRGVEGPPDVLTCRDGFLQAFASDRNTRPRALTYPPETEFRTPNCYLKLWPCCRHVQPAIEALIAILNENGLSDADITRINVDTYEVAAEYAHTGWADFASAQLSFAFLMALAARRKNIALDDFTAESRADATLNRLASIVEVAVAPDLDRLYPSRRPARVTLVTRDGRVIAAERMEALGAREEPMSENQIDIKFYGNVTARLGAERTGALRDMLRPLASCASMRTIIAAAAARRRVD